MKLYVHFTKTTVPPWTRGFSSSCGNKLLSCVHKLFILLESLPDRYVVPIRSIHNTCKIINYTNKITTSAHTMKQISPFSPLEEPTNVNQSEDQDVNPTLLLISWALCSKHPSWLPPSTSCTLEKSFTSSTRRQNCHWTIRAAIMFPWKCVFRNKFLRHRVALFIFIVDLCLCFQMVFRLWGGPCFVLPRALKSLHPLLHLILRVCWCSHEDSMQIVRN